MPKESVSFIIETDSITKKFGDFTAVDSVNLGVKRGEIFGLLGPNGAGKTTLISMMCTMLIPTSGSATVNGYDAAGEPSSVRKSIGIVFQDQSLDDRLTGRENLELHAMLYNIGKKTADARIKEVLKIVELEDRADDFVRAYSGGMRRRLEIARGLVHHPKVLFLDEPTLGLDPQTRKHVWTYIQRLAKKKKITIVMTTHYMEEADALCDRVAIIDHGKIITMDTPKSLKSSIGKETITLKLKHRGDGVRGKVKKAFPNANILDGTIYVPVKNAESQMKSVYENAKKAGIRFTEIGMKKPTLNDVFLHLTGREIREERANSKDAMKNHMRMRGRR
jgi:ABC-2 type transport system ATP-binding protein